MIVERVFLVGLSGSGKTTVGRQLSRRLGWKFADTDEAIESRSGRTVASIFAADGEERFRDLEEEALRDVAGSTEIVIATGGGVPLRETNRKVLATGLVIWLDITARAAESRLAGGGGAEQRPLLAGDTGSRLESLFEQRRHLYERSDHSIAVEFYETEKVVEMAVELVERALASGWAPSPDRFEEADAARRRAASVAATVHAAGGSYPVIVDAGALEEVGAICRERELTGRAFVLTDSNVEPLFVPKVVAELEAAGFEARSFAIPAGEPSKTMATVALVHDWLLEARVERSDFLVCLGGGVVTDLGGFAAATVLRGIAFVHVPTTMAGMVDAAVGGKTGVDHPRGKNLIGAFAQPQAVIADPSTLESLPERELRAGVAELIKHGFIIDRSLVAELESAAGDLSALASPELIARSVAIKAAVVSGDEREAGARTLLNYGHTVGHAIEATSGYAEYLHGEAVAVGMRAAGLIGVSVEMLERAEFQRQQQLIRECGLPEQAPGLDPDAIRGGNAR